jgi:hypothetical protein
MNVTTSPLPKLLTLLCGLAAPLSLGAAENPTAYTVPDLGTLGHQVALLQKLSARRFGIRRP